MINKFSQLFLIMVTVLIILFSWTEKLYAASTCSVNTTAINFGIYWGDVPLASTGKVIISCSLNSTIVRINLNAGNSNQFNSRSMKSGLNTIAYNLYTDSAHTTIWGDGTLGTSQVTITTNALFSTQRLVYGLMPSNQNIPAGNYSDTLLVTIIW